MKRFKLLFLIMLLLFLFSCAGTQKKQGSGNNEQLKEETVEQAGKPAEKIEESKIEGKIEPEDLAVAAAEEPAEIPAEIPLNEEIAQADSGDEHLANAASLSTETEPAVARESAAVTPSVSQAQPSQIQPSQTRQSVQEQPTVQPQQQTQTPPVQQSNEEKAAASETSLSDNDSQSKKEPSSFADDGNFAPAARIESFIQMGTMPHDNKIVFSRIVYATVGQIVEIPFRGNGWVYLGEITSRRGIVYNPRRNDSDGQSFIFTLEEAGTYILRFYRQDFIRDYIINDHVQIIAEEAPAAGTGWLNPAADRGKVVAQPRWPSSVEETQIRNGTRPTVEPVVTSGISSEPARETAPAQSTAPQQRTPAPETNTNRTPTNPPAASSTASGQATPVGQTASVGQTAAPAQTASPGQTTAAVQNEGENLSVEKQEKLAPEVMLQKARENFDGGNISAAITLLDQFMTDYPGGSDEAYWQLGQYYEANSPSRNILLSLDYYRRLVNEYPQSTRFNDARRRIAYLERYYINIQ
jgi:hypothetical protein